MNVRIHATAMIEEGVELGAGTAIWDHAHIRHHACLGEECIVGGKASIAYDVRIGNRCKIGPFVSVCAGVEIEDGVMLAIGVVFTNELFPRATTPDLSQLRDSSPTDRTLTTRVCAGATIGANATVRGGLEIGRWSMIGMGSVVTRSVRPFHLVMGNPARLVGCVCRCGDLLERLSADRPVSLSEITCASCGLKYRIELNEVSELTPPASPLGEV